MHNIFNHVYFYIILRHMQSPLFPYTTLFRSLQSRSPRFYNGYYDSNGDSGVEAQHSSLAFYYWRFSAGNRSEEHTSELQSRRDLVCRLLLEKKKIDCKISSFLVTF